MLYKQKKKENTKKKKCLHSNSILKLKTIPGGTYHLP